MSSALNNYINPTDEFLENLRVTGGSTKRAMNALKFGSSVSGSCSYKLIVAPMTKAKTYESKFGTRGSKPL